MYKLPPHLAKLFLYSVARIFRTIPLHACAKGRQTDGTQTDATYDFLFKCIFSNRGHAQNAKVTGTCRYKDSGTRIQNLYPSQSLVRYSTLPRAVWCSAVHTCSHTRFIDRFMMSEEGDPLSLPFTSKTGQSHSVAQNRQTSFYSLY